MSVSVLILSHITGINYGRNMFLKYEEQLHQIQFSFLVPCQVIEVKLKGYTEWDSTPVYCIFTILPYQK